MDLPSLAQRASPWDDGLGQRFGFNHSSSHHMVCWKPPSCYLEEHESQSCWWFLDSCLPLSLSLFFCLMSLLPSFVCPLPSPLLQSNDCKAPHYYSPHGDISHYVEKPAASL